VFALVAAEGVLRIYVAMRGWTPNCYAAQLTLFRPHPVVGCDLAPNFRLRSGTFVISTNSLGFRGPEMRSQKPTGTKRIAIVGGSAVFGYLVNDGQEAARLLQEGFRSDGCAVEVINAGVPGYNLFQSLVRYEETVAPLAIDIVILYAGFNDLPYLMSEVPDADNWQRRPVASYWERLLGRSVGYGLVAYRLGQHGSEFTDGVRLHATVTEAGRAQFRSNLQAMADAVQRSGASLVICAQATAARHGVTGRLRSQLGSSDEEIERTIQTFAWIHETLQKFADEQQAMFIDVSSEIPPTSQYLGDVIHLTVEGERRLAGVLARRLKPLIEPCVATDAHNQP
jgi:lysophospholipase L1-like esterase